MRKLSLAVAAIVLSAVLLFAPQEAQARHRGVAIGIIGGIAAAALVGSAIAHPYYYGYPGPGYGYAPAYAYYPPVYYRRAYYPPPYYGYYGPVVYPRCYWQRRSVWNGFRWRRARVRVCY